jgi:hypothetical protein
VPRRRDVSRRVRLHLTCGLGKATIVSKLNAATSTLHGGFSLRGHFVTFTLMKNPS